MSEQQPKYELMYEGSYEDEDCEGKGMEQLTPYEVERLRVFEHIIKQANEMDARLRSRTPQTMHWVERNPDGSMKSQSKMWEENGRMLKALRDQSLHMYTGSDITVNDHVDHIDGFIDKPHMKEAADFILMGIKREKEEAEMFDIHELESMWDNGQE